MGFCPQAVVWGDVATWAAAVGTIVIGVLAWRTAIQATRIAQLQHAHETKERSESARITGRLLYNELSIFPDRMVEMLRALTAAVDWQNQNQVVNATALKHALRELETTLLPNAEAVLDRIHHLPQSLGADLASLISVTRSLQATAHVSAGRTIDFATGSALYAGNLMELTHLHKQVSLIVDLSMGLAHEWQDFVGVPRTAYHDLERELLELCRRAGYDLGDEPHRRPGAEPPRSEQQAPT